LTCAISVILGVRYQWRQNRAAEKQGSAPAGSSGQLGITSLRFASASMSNVSGTGSSSTTDEMLTDIMKRPDAMDDKLKAFDPLREKVASLEASVEELSTQHQQVSLIAAVERVDIAHTAWNAKVNLIEAGQRAPAQD
jgi:hypothetical protein